jgi:hypothetical protein
MPNWTQTALTAPKPVIDSLINAEGQVDFNLVVPPPAEYPKAQAIDEDLTFPDWYEWNCANWGTKWNATRTKRITNTIVRFDTAWATPYPVMKKLAESSGESLQIEWRDEHDGGRIEHKLTLNPDGTEDYTCHDPADDLKVGETYYELRSDSGRGGWKARPIELLEELEGRWFKVMLDGEVSEEHSERIAEDFTWPSKDEVEARATELNAEESAKHPQAEFDDLLPF